MHLNIGEDKANLPVGKLRQHHCSGLRRFKNALLRCAAADIKYPLGTLMRRAPCVKIQSVIDHGAWESNFRPCLGERLRARIADMDDAGKLSVAAFPQRAVNDVLYSAAGIVRLLKIMRMKNDFGVRQAPGYCGRSRQVLLDDDKIRRTAQRGSGDMIGPRKSRSRLPSGQTVDVKPRKNIVNLFGKDPRGAMQSACADEIADAQIDRRRSRCPEIHVARHNLKHGW